MQPNTARYSFPFILIHWVLVLLVLVLLGLGWYIQYLPPTAPARSFLLDLHISLGLTSAILVSVQIFLRIISKAPFFPESFPQWQKRLAYTLNLLIYVSIVMMLASGYLQTIFSATPVNFWGVPIPVWESLDVELVGLFWTLHGIVAVVLAGLIFVYVGIVALNIFKQTGIAARMPPMMERDSSQLIQVETSSPVASKIVQRLAKNLRLFGWLEFWLQLALAFISGLLLVFATSGRTFSPGATGVSDGMYWAV